MDDAYEFGVPDIGVKVEIVQIAVGPGFNYDVDLYGLDRKGNLYVYRRGWEWLSGLRTK